MDYEKKIREYMASSEVDQLYKSMLINLFPELKDSEGERIRKALLEMVHDTTGDSLWVDYNVHKEDAIAWLEKQGENTYNKELSELLHKVICRFINDPDIPYSDREEVSMKVLSYVERLEKQNEQKQEETWPNLSNCLHDCKKCTGKCLYRKEKYQGEQKPADKVEPKFKIGDKVIPKNHQEESLTITKVADTEYYSGDLLICKIDEQDKWELVEQKPVEHLELKAGHWYICHRAYCCRADHLTVKEGERFMCEKDGVVKGFVIKNPENYFKEVSAPAPLKDEYNLLWSEEDESNRIIIEGELLSSQRNANPYEHATYDKLISWVNYLKDRILSQPKQEWSEEDEDDILHICCWFNEYGNLLLGKSEDKSNRIFKTVDRLKSLKERYTWKPSEEQLRELENVFGDRSAGWDDRILESLYNDLKALLK